MMATALGTCIATTMALYGERNNLDLTGVRVRVVKEMSSDPPRRIVRLAADVFMPMPRLAMHAEKLERVARGCPVHQSLHPMIDKPVRFHWET
jgi:putative redox protein